MKKIILAVLIFTAIGVTANAQSSSYTNGYVKKDGTVVGGYYHTDKNSTTSDNWSTRGNTNPVTGQPGYKAPSYPSSPYSPSYPSSGRRVR
jgi:hypothetical protein